MPPFHVHLAGICALAGGVIIVDVMTRRDDMTMSRAAWKPAIFHGGSVAHMWACLLWAHRKQQHPLGFACRRRFWVCAICWAPMVLSMAWNPMELSSAIMEILGQGVAYVFIATIYTAWLCDASENVIPHVYDRAGRLHHKGRWPHRLPPRQAFASPAA
jgi:hypothetical protein